MYCCTTRAWVGTALQRASLFQLDERCNRHTNQCYSVALTGPFRLIPIAKAPVPGSWKEVATFSRWQGREMMHLQQATWWLLRKPATFATFHVQHFQRDLVLCLFPSAVQASPFEIWTSHCFLRNCAHSLLPLVRRCWGAAFHLT